ncbi:MAG: hypothetical protein JWL81_1244 [Verrucomicrobiales bacterium]|nr:hypothetical protein [Verrucomicrobiales bacterium]
MPSPEKSNKNPHYYHFSPPVARPVPALFLNHSALHLPRFLNNLQRQSTIQQMQSLRNNPPDAPAGCYFQNDRIISAACSDQLWRASEKQASQLKTRPGRALLLAPANILDGLSKSCRFAGIDPEFVYFRHLTPDTFPIRPWPPTLLRSHRRFPGNSVSSAPSFSSGRWRWPLGSCFRGSFSIPLSIT